MHDLQRLRFVTERYPHLQGLRLIPLGLPFLVSAAWRDGQLEWVPGTAGLGPGLWFLALLLTALVISVAMGSYYRHRFGTVEPKRDLTSVLAGLLFAVLFLCSLGMQDILPFNISLPAVVIGTGVGYLGVAGGQQRTHYLALAALSLFFATLGSFGVPLHARDVLLDDLIGIGLIVIGVGDHLLLRRTLEPVSHVETV
jgi:hypothetical protein